MDSYDEEQSVKVWRPTSEPNIYSKSPREHSNEKMREETPTYTLAISHIVRQVLFLCYLDIFHFHIPSLEDDTDLESTGAMISNPRLDLGI